LCDEGTQVSAIPKLSVNSNEVQCKHSLSLSGVDENSIEYLTTRGYSYEDAKKAVIQAFLQ
jgi:Fe-S cluster assembly protein SufD